MSDITRESDEAFRRFIAAWTGAGGKAWVLDPTPDKEQCWRDGAAAHAEGRSLDACPYSGPLGEEWMRGWEAAERASGVPESDPLGLEDWT